MTATESREEKTENAAEEVTDRILTVPNIVTLIRLALLPVFLWLEFVAHEEIAALVVFAVASGTDWVDGQIARRTHQVSKLGKLFDPFVDRLLIAVGVIAVFLLGRVPLWILLYLICRDCILLIGGKILLNTVGKVPAVVYPGKFATAFIMFGFCFLLLGFPSVPGLGLQDVPVWLPGFGPEPVLFGIWLIYAGLVCSVSVFVYYIVSGVKYLMDWRAGGNGA